MAYKYVTLVDKGDFNRSALYHETISLGLQQTSDDYILPITEIKAIVVVSVTGGGRFYITIDPPGIIEEGSAYFERLLSLNNINIAITGFRIESRFQPVVMKVTVRTVID